VPIGTEVGDSHSAIHLVVGEAGAVEAAGEGADVDAGPIEVIVESEA
jgi:hypothetical protein